MGNPAASTPILDAFAAEDAVSFRRAYCQSPVCVPSRCSFATGLYPHVRGHRTMQHLLHADEPSIFSELKDAGYHVWMNGRCDLIAGQIPGLAESHADEVRYSPRVPGAARAPGDGFKFSHFGGRLDSAADSDMDDTRAAVARILDRPADKPLCLFLGWINPHPAYQVEEPYFSRIDREKVPERIRASETHGKHKILRSIRSYTGLENYGEERWRELRAVYLAQCAKVDAMCGMVFDALRQAGIYDDSAIFVFSDHGDFAGDYDLPEKAQNAFEDVLTRVPLLIKPPKDAALDAGITDSLAELVDFYATAMDLAGVEPSHDQYGRSLRPVLADRTAAVREYAFCEGGRCAYEYQCDEYHANGMSDEAPNVYWPKMKAQLDPEAHEKGAMITDGRWKYVRRLSGNDELYDLSADPGERVNLFGSMGTERETLRLREALLDWYERTCDIVPREYDERFTRGRMEAMVIGACPPEHLGELRGFMDEKPRSISELMEFMMKLR